MKLPVRRRDRDVYSWDPFDEIRKMQDYMEQMFNMEQMSRTFPALESRFGTGTSSPLTDVVEENDKVIVTTELPGIERENIELNLRDNVLIISAAKEKKKKPK